MNWSTGSKLSFETLTFESPTKSGSGEPKLDFKLAKKGNFWNAPPGGQFYKT